MLIEAVKAKKAVEAVEVVSTPILWSLKRVKTPFYPFKTPFYPFKTPFYPFKTPFYTLALKKSDYFIKAHNRMVKLYEKHPFIHFKFIPSSLALKDNYRFFDVNYTIYFKGCF
jgi:hypothetical protein